MKTKITKIILEVDGQEYTAYPLTDEEIQRMKESTKAMNIDFDDCNCGDEWCIDGYIYRCAYGPSGRCQVFRSDVRCN